MKKIKILIITLVIILVLGVATFATLYFTTDVFKSDKELFYKYISQMDLSQITNTTGLDKYQERLKSEKYKNEGSVTIQANMGEETNLNESFEYVSQVDAVNGFANSIVTINRDEEELLTVDYLRNEDLYGVRFEGIVSQYIAFENNSLKEFAQNLGIEDVSNIPDKIDLSNYNSNEIISEEQLKQISDRYINIIIEQIPKENYSKVEDGYKLTIDLKTIQNILIKVINTLKDDEEIFSLINSIVNTLDSEQQLDYEEYKENLEELIEELSEQIEENFNIVEIITYKQSKIYVRIATDVVDGGTSYIDGNIIKNEGNIVFSFNAGDEYDEIINCTISKNLNTTDNEECNIQLILKEDEEEVGNINIITTRNGNLSSNNIKNSMIANIMVPEENIEISMEYNNNRTFDSSIEIEEFNENNYVAINELSAEQINNLITNLGNMISEKSDLNIIEGIGAAGIGLISTATMDLQKTAVLTGVITGVTINVSLNGDLFDTSRNAMQETQNVMEQEERLMFNIQFSIYEGIQSGSDVRMLIRTISASNASNPQHLVRYSNINVDTSKTYNVSFEKDEEGYINKVIIEEQ